MKRHTTCLESSCKTVLKGTGTDWDPEDEISQCDGDGSEERTG